MKDTDHEICKNGGQLREKIHIKVRWTVVARGLKLTHNLCKQDWLQNILSSRTLTLKMLLTTVSKEIKMQSGCVQTGEREHKKREEGIKRRFKRKIEYTREKEAGIVQP